MMAAHVEEAAQHAVVAAHDEQRLAGEFERDELRRARAPGRARQAYCQVLANVVRCSSSRMRGSMYQAAGGVQAPSSGVVRLVAVDQVETRFVMACVSGPVADRPSRGCWLRTPGSASGRWCAAGSARRSTDLHAADADRRTARYVLRSRAVRRTTLWMNSVQRAARPCRSRPTGPASCRPAARRTPRGPRAAGRTQLLAVVHAPARSCVAMSGNS